ncbi:hypothetical protein [uncultured Jatrophihabitans sp.]|uniref:hypothetical protein n=1 Tax=uncultured Jatrophihabitans sp. TaxID=1610747 RepID=UPI0035C9C32E
MAYYRRDWRGVLVSAGRLVRLGFGMSWGRTVRGAWLVLRANQAWAPYPDNDPERARRLMRGFYALVVRDGGLTLDPERAARLEVEWWRVHRARQRENALTEDDLLDSLVALYAYVYGSDEIAVRPAAEHRTRAMRHSDDWHRDGCALDDPRLTQERAELVAAYTALLAAVRP